MWDVLNFLTSHDALLLRVFHEIDKTSMRSLFLSEAVFFAFSDSTAWNAAFGIDGR